MTGYVVLAVFRPDPRHLQEQIASLRAQTLTDWRCTVGIDGPDPAARSAAVEACGGDPRFAVSEHDSHVGHFRHFERLLAGVPSSSEWVALCDQDDVWHPEKLDRLTRALPTASIVQGEAMVASPTRVSRATRRTDRGLSALLADNQVTGSFAVLRTQVLQLALPFPEPTTAAYHDHWLGVCGQVLDGVTTLHEALQTYRQHDDNVIGEVAGGRVGARSRALATAAGSWRPRAMLDTVASERLAWRVTMARTILARTGVRPEDQAVLRAYARGTLTRQLTKLLVLDVLGRRVPPARGLALLAGAGWATVTGRR